ncbi:hypothetical protein ACQZ4Q_09335 [Agrobacterium vitis]|uniref:hypothetical protein n=1 Tax=Agrobacterium vitis TaxID=373 RepID=UPI003D2CE549
MQDEPTFTNPKTKNLWNKGQENGFGLYFLGDKAVLWANVDDQKRTWHWVRGMVVPANMDGLDGYSTANDALIACETDLGLR